MVRIVLNFPGNRGFDGLQKAALILCQCQATLQERIQKVPPKGTLYNRGSFRNPEGEP